jgi:protein-tyrosine phosphatase
MMIDLHTHLLPGLDDGPGTIDDSIALARGASDAGTSVMVATPHIREDHPFSPREIAPAVSTLSHALESSGVSLDVVPGGEVSISTAMDLDDAMLRAVSLGGTSHILVESPYTFVGDLMETVLFDLQVKGYRPVLAHPERSPSFQRDIGRLTELVRKGVICSVTAGSITGHFGKRVRLVHNVASDAHDLVARRPDLRPGLHELETAVPSVATRSRWLVRDVPAAILADQEIPAPPPLSRGRRWLRKRELRRDGSALVAPGDADRP